MCLYLLHHLFPSRAQAQNLVSLRMCWNSIPLDYFWDLAPQTAFFTTNSATSQPGLYSLPLFLQVSASVPSPSDFLYRYI